MNYIYLSGPISGRPREEYDAHFAKIEREIDRMAKSANMEIWAINPVRYCDYHVAEGSPWHVYMRACIGKLLECDGIGLLQGWEKSRGAALELDIAGELNIPIVYIEPPFDIKNLYDIFHDSPALEVCYYHQRQLEKLEAINPDTAWDRALVETANRYLDPHGFEYIEKPF